MKHSHKIITVLVLAIFAGAAFLLWPRMLHMNGAPQKQGDIPPVSYAQFTLDNGLQVIVLPNHSIPALCHMIWLRAGAGDDPAGASGTAHFLEHMMFRGTASQPPGEYSRLLTRLGAESNAFTGRDVTAYHATLAKEHLEKLMSMEAERWKHFGPPAEEYPREHEVIMEERRVRIDNKPDRLLDEKMQFALFPAHPYGIPVIGWMEEMRGLKPDYVKAFHDRYYQPKNAILVLAGDVTEQEARTLAEKYYGDIPNTSEVQRATLPDISAIEPTAKTVTLAHPDVKRMEWLRDVRVPSLVSGDTALAMPLSVLSRVLGEGQGSRLYKALVVDKRLAVEVDSGYYPLTRGPAVFSLEATPADGVSPEAVEAAVGDVLKQLAEEGPKEEELTRAKTVLMAESIYEREGLTSLAFIFGQMRALGLPDDLFNQWPILVERVTPADVQNAARLVLVAPGVNGLLLPEAAKEAAP